MRDAGTVWLVAGGEPGAERFGQLVQRLRKNQEMSVEELATAAELSVGSIRAIEQARRAPSEESGVRLLRVLLPEGALSTPKPDREPQQAGADITFVDPESGGTVVLQFKAKTAGDNRRWSSDKPRAGETRVEAFVRELMADPERYAAWLEQQRRAWSNLPDYRPLFEDLRARAARPADDDAFGRVVRRIATANEFRLQYLETLLDWWERVDSGEAEEYERELVSRAEDLFNSYQKISPEEWAAAEE